MTIIGPTIETTKDFILIKIPRSVFKGRISVGEVSLLERGLGESIKEANAGKLIGPFRNAKTFLRALKKPVRRREP